MFCSLCVGLIVCSRFDWLRILGGRYCSSSSGRGATRLPTRTATAAAADWRPRISMSRGPPAQVNLSLLPLVAGGWQLALADEIMSPAATREREREQRWQLRVGARDSGENSAEISPLARQVGISGHENESRIARNTLGRRHDAPTSRRRRTRRNETARCLLRSKYESRGRENASKTALANSPLGWTLINCARKVWRRDRPAASWSRDDPLLLGA